MTETKPIILHIPHSSTYIPFYNGYVTNETEIINEKLILTDWLTEMLFDLPFTKVIAPFSRVFCDVERFPDDSSEVMAQFGMGMCYTHFDDGRLMRNVSPALRNKIKAEFYEPHHQRLENSVNYLLSQHGKAFVIDCHSYPDRPLNRDLQRDLPRPDFCIGTDEFHTPKNIADYAYEFIRSKGFEVKINNPYAGTMIPLQYFNKENEVAGMMIEVNRKLYMRIENNLAVKTNDFENIRILIEKLVANISDTY